jgi:hypothetical protein
MTKRDRKKRMEEGPDSAGQSGATQQISDARIADRKRIRTIPISTTARKIDRPRHS